MYIYFLGSIITPPRLFQNIYFDSKKCLKSNYLSGSKEEENWTINALKHDSNIYQYAL